MSTSEGGGGPGGCMEHDRALAEVEHLDSLGEHTMLRIGAVDEMRTDGCDSVPQLDAVLGSVLDRRRRHLLELEAGRRDAVSVSDPQSGLAQRLFAVGGVGERVQLDRRVR